MSELFKDQKQGVILSASRMCDMPKYYPNDIITETEKRLKKGLQIHTLVLWTKHPASLLVNPLYDFLIKLKAENTQIFVQLTITGMGGLVVGKRTDGKPMIPEPNVPRFEEALKILPKIIELTGNAQRIKLRIDPVARIKDTDGKVFSNLKYFPVIVDFASKLGIQNFVFSFLEKGFYRKVDMRYVKIGGEIIPPDNNERYTTALWLQKLQAKYDVRLEACNVLGFDESRCVDGNLLMQLHDDKNFFVSLKQPRSRALCGCTESIDIGGWPPKKCYSGCDYCYANSDYKL